MLSETGLAQFDKLFRVWVTKRAACPYKNDKDLCLITGFICSYLHCLFRTDTVHVFTGNPCPSCGAPLKDNKCEICSQGGG